MNRITKDNMGDCQNDKAESMQICNARENTEVRIYDNGTPQLTANEEHDDDYLRIYVHKDMDHCLDIKSLEESHQTEYVTYELNGNGNGRLNGDVSSYAFFRGIANNCI
jgi:hypothetical protein